MAHVELPPGSMQAQASTSSHGHLTKNALAPTTSQFVDNRFSISWSQVKHIVRDRHSAEDKTILAGVGGYCQPGEMLALMGPSGCGKTTLLDILGDRLSSGKTEGNIMIGQHTRDAASSRKIIGYVAQEDALLTCFTVRETLRYTAQLTLASLSWLKREERINMAMDQMGLAVCADTRVGDILLKGISGGQKRRLSIAVELLQASPILLLDEPTSGLDSAAALQVMQCLRRVANRGHTVIMSIHQPGSDIYNLFNSLCLLSGGRQLYFGPIGQAAIAHFANLGHECPQYTNPAEYFLSLANTDFAMAMFNDVESMEVQNVVRKLADAYPSSNIASKAAASAKGLDKVDPKGYVAVSAAGPAKQFVVLLVRILHMSWKSPYIYAVRLVMYIALSFMVGTMYWGVGTTARSPKEGQQTYRAAYSLLPLLFYVQAFLVFMSVAVLPFFLEQRDVFRRERANGQIFCLPYVLANFLANLPGVLIIATVSSVLVVFSADLNGFWPFFLNLFISLIAAESLMHVIGAAQPHYIIGMAFGAGLFGMFMLCEGFMVPFQDIPAGWVWGHRIAMHTYAFEWFMHNQFSGLQGGFYGSEILERYGMQNVDGTRNGCMLLGYAVLFEIGFFLVLKVFHTGRR